jgi:hypothetical protein
MRALRRYTHTPHGKPLIKMAKKHVLNVVIVQANPMLTATKQYLLHFMVYGSRMI